MDYCFIRKLKSFDTRFFLKLNKNINQTPLIISVKNQYQVTLNAVFWMKGLQSNCFNIPALRFKLRRLWTFIQLFQLIIKMIFFCSTVAFATVSKCLRKTLSSKYFYLVSSAKNRANSPRMKQTNRDWSPSAVSLWK